MSAARVEAAGGTLTARTSSPEAEKTGTLEDRKVARWHTPLFTVLVILGVIGLVVAAVGAAGYFRVGALSHLNQMSAIAMMASGGGGGILLLICGIVGMVRPQRETTEVVATTTLPDLIPVTVKQGIKAIDTTYDRTNNDGVLDLVYLDREYGYACVVDGTGHNNPRMREPLLEHFNSFIVGYDTSMQNFPPSTFEGTLSHFRQQINALNERFNDQNLPHNQVKVCPQDKETPEVQQDKRLGTFLDPSYRPAMSFAQLVRNDDQLFLLTAQAGDTMILVEMADGELRTTQKSSHTGVGDGLSVESFDITGAKRVIGFSDGIGEFMTFEELKGVINGIESSQLAARLKEKVISRRIVVDRSAQAANGTRLKVYDPSKPSHVDDIGLFVLDLYAHRVNS